MRFRWTFLAGAALLGAFGLGAQIQAPTAALAQFSSAPGDASNPILRLPAPPAPPGARAPQIPLPPQNSRAKTPPALLPTPILTFKPRFAGQKSIRVGLSTAGAPIAVYAPGGATLFDLNQPKQVLSLPPGARVEMRFGPNQMAKSFRGPVSVSTAGQKIDGWQRVYIAIDGEAARVTTNGKNPRWGRAYRGDLEIFPQKLGEPVKRKGPLSLVNVVPLESYLRGVVPWEMDASAPLEALKAQAICARTKALDFIRSKRFGKGDFEICDYDACQGYPGTENEKPATTKAVESTQGLAIYYRNRPIDAVYSTNSGGITANARDVWPSGAPIPYLQSVADFAPDSPGEKLWQSGMDEAKWAQFCAQNLDSFAQPGGIASDKYEARKYRWKEFVSVEAASKAFAGEGISAVTVLEILERAASGRIRRLRVTGVDAARLKTWPTPVPNPKHQPSDGISALAVSFPPKSVAVEGDGKIRSMFSGRLGSTTALPSSLFTVSPVTDASGKLLGWNLQGAGWGHGVGMCQRGAQNHAKAGWDARKILSWYYRGVEIR